MKIVILDGYVVNPGDISWDCIASLGDMTCYDRTAPSDYVKRIGDAEILLVSDCPVSRETISQCSNLKFIGTLSTGFNHIDVDYARQRGIAVCNVPAYAAEPVSQHTFALILEIANNIGDYNRQIKEGRWYESPDPVFIDKALCSLAHRSLGIIGYGAIGRKVGEIAKAFGMELNIYDAFADEYKNNLDAAISSDFVTLHCPATSDNQGMVNKDFIGRMKDGAVLINAARGVLVNETDLADALISGKLAAAGLDVLSVEPPRKPNPLIPLPNCYLTPHIAWATKEARTLVAETSAMNIKSFLLGEKLNRVD